jgi:cyclopropane-fatty-acyl-phospholipid synthase
MNEALATSRRIYELLVAKTTAAPPAMRSWTDETWGPADAPATIVLRHPGALRAALFPPSDLVAGEAYIYDDIDIEGEMFPLLHWAAELDAMRSSPRDIFDVARLLRSLPNDSRRRDAIRPNVAGRLHSRRRDSAAVRHHYDTGNDFFELFLDPEMVYSCAYFLDRNEKLAEAQRRKLDLICRKLQLRPGQRLLDVGCGWGALVRHAAANYGVEAVGVTLSPRQAEEAEKRNRLFGLADRVSIRVQDYRDVAGEFDAIASVGMFEHVGGKELATYFTKLHELLGPQGILLNHGITTRARPGRFARPRKSFVNTYVFPDGELLPIEQSIEAAEAAGFETRDVENIRTSYALTLRHWVANLEANREAAIAAADDLTYRIWRMYMAGSAVAFESAAIAVYQAIYTTAGRDWTLGRTWATAGDDL